jgi:hypothetical protein
MVFWWNWLRNWLLLERGNETGNIGENPWSISICSEWGNGRHWLWLISIDEDDDDTRISWSSEENEDNEESDSDGDGKVSNDS